MSVTEKLPLQGFNIGLSAAVPERSAWTERALDRAILEFVAVFSALVFKYGGRIIHGAHPTFTPVIVRQARRHADSGLQKPITLVISELWAKSLNYDEVARYQEVAEILVTDQVGEGGLENIETRKASPTLMRRHLVQRMNTMVAVDGKSHETEDSVSGVLEEVGFAARRGMACFLVGLMAEAVKEQNSPISFPGS